MTAQLSAKDVARYVGTSATNLRKFLRSPASNVEPVGKGKRYTFTEDQLESIKDAYEVWAGFKPVPKQPKKKKGKAIELNTTDEYNGRSFLPAEQDELGESDVPDDLDELLDHIMTDEEAAWLDDLDEFDAMIFDIGDED